MTLVTRWAFWLFISCCVIVVGAMGWITALTIQLDGQDAEAQRRAEREENTRLALWRMDSALAPLVSQETTRPYFQFTPFYPVVGSYTASLKEVEDGDLFAPSPLVTFRSRFIHLHFQADRTGQVTSPQVPDGVLRETLRRQLGISVASTQRVQHLQRCAQLLDAAAIRDRMAAICGDEFQVVSRTHGGAEGSGLALVCTPLWAFSEQGTRSQATAPDEDSPDAVQQSASPPAKQMGRSRVDPEQQQLRNAAEFSQRRKSLSNSSQLSQSASSYLVPPEKTQREVPKGGDENVFASALAWGEVRATPFQWAWVGDELFYLRRVRFGDRESLQGCWFDWSEIRKVLHDEIIDLLPKAELRTLSPGEYTGMNARGDTTNYTLASLPVALVPGEIPTTGDQLSPTIRNSLVVAWTCVLLAIVAVGALLRGAMALSERRADFVSAVTHELRTPLTTFRLYLDLLTSGRVAEPEHRQEYLTTLQGESERLGHLVENVLRYARLERGQTNAGHESVTAEALLDRCLDRLRRRATQGGAELVVDLGASARNVELRTDPLAVEQILYNLVDNACKYGVTDESRSIRLEVRGVESRCQWRVVDAGPGLSSEARRRLFRPFSKSAKRAAQSAAGVGLGLALCRRLARELGGDLRHEPSERGTCMVLELG